MFESAATRVLLADHTKFERRALHAMGSLYDFDVIVVDDRTPPATYRADEGARDAGRRRAGVREGRLEV